MPCLLTLSAPVTAGNSLVYTRQAAVWTQALPLGNGRIGAMVWGDPETETISLGEVTLWAGGPDPGANDLCGRENLDKMREAFFAGDIKEGNRLGQEHLSGHGKSFGTNLPLGDIVIDFSGKGEVGNYVRSLDLDSALARVSYSRGGAEHTGEYLCSNPAGVFAARFTSSDKRGINARVSVRLLRYGSIKASDGVLEISGDARRDGDGEKGVSFLSVIRVSAPGGTVESEGDEITVAAAGELIVTADIRTDFRQPEYASLCRRTVGAASARDWEEIKKEHVTDYRRLFSRTDISLGENQSRDGQSGPSFEAELSRARAGNASPAFDALFFNYGRYMLISSSREDSPLPAHLQGVWNDNLACNMAWTCDYHLDINIQQNYWAANVANLAECNAPLFSYLRLLEEYGAVTAEKMYGCRGWVTHTINNVWGDTAPGSGVGWAVNVTAGAWLATHLWTHYDFTRDREWLGETGYPLLKETALFFTDYMTEDPRTGYLVTGPSISPETSFRAADGECYSLSMMPTVDRAVVHEIYKSCIEAARVLDTDADFREKLERDIKRLPPYGVHPEGDLKEWLLDVRRPDISHRHSSHLLGLYPFGEITPEKTPELARACDRFLSMQTEDGNWEDNEWSRGCMINYYARLRDARQARGSLLKLYSGFMRDNLMTVSPAGVAGAESDIFSFDATEAAVAGMCEMILQSHGGYLDFLPCLPEEWKDGKISGICARGGITADIAWKDGKVVSASLRSETGQKVECRINGEKRTVILTAGETVKVI